MKGTLNLAVNGKELHSHLWTVVLCGVAGLALATPAIAKDKGVIFNPGAPVEINTTVNEIREVPVGQPLPGMHLDLKVDGRVTDVYIAPMDFCVKFDVKVAKGDQVFIVGMRVPAKAGEAETILAREITTGIRDPRNGVFHPTLTVYLRNDDGPFWVEPKLDPNKLPKPTPAVETTTGN